MLAGPNGAGKSTFHRVYLSALELPFLNADVLRASTGMGVYEAASQTTAIRRLMVERGQSFVTETVLSDPVGEKVEFLAGAVEAGFDVQLIFIGIDDSAMAVKRVKSRVKRGGHSVPEEKIVARYLRNLDNLERAIVLLPRVTIYDNSSYETPFRLLGEFRSGEVFQKTMERIPVWAERFFSRGGRSLS